MYLYYLLGWKMMTKYYVRWANKEDETTLRNEVKVRYEELHRCRQMQAHGPGMRAHMQPYMIIHCIFMHASYDKH